MSEIDDKYQENIELLDNEFFEGHKQGKKKKEIIEHYKKNLEKHRTTYEEEYKKKLTKEKQQLNNKKKKKKKERQKPYETLNVKHFDFKFSTWQKIKHKTTITWFNISRTYHKTTNKIIPIWTMYLYYKTTITLKAFYKELTRKIGNGISATKKFLITTGKKTAKTTKTLGKNSIKILKKIISTLHFWKKKENKKKEETDKEGEENKEDTQTGEEKGETQKNGEEEKKEPEQTT